MTYLRGPIRPFRWLRAMFCPWFGHRFGHNSDNTYRVCYHCRKEERRHGMQVWKD